MRLLLALLIVPACVVFGSDDPTTAEVDRIFSRFTSPGSPGCAVGVMREGRLILARGYGLASVEHNVAITPSTIFDLASTSKQFTAAAVVLLAQEGKLSLEDDVRRFLPELPDYGRTITIRHLLNHTSGIRDYLVLMSLIGTHPDGVTGDDDALKLIAAQKKLNFQPGDDHLYSNSGYFLLSLIVRRASGQSLRDYAQAAIFTPLGMKATLFRDRHDEVVRNRAAAYSRTPQGQFRISMSGFEQTGDGALHTNIEDLLAWDNNFYTHTVGGPAMVAAMTTWAKRNDGAELDYGLGLYRGKHRGLDMIHHGGSWAGYRAELIRFPGQRLSVACLCNVADSNAPHLARRVAEIYLAGELSPADSPQTAAAGGGTQTSVALTNEEMDKLSGLYADPESGTFRGVSRNGTRLELDTFGMGKCLMVPLAGGRFQVVGAPFPAEARLEGSTLRIRWGSQPEEVVRKQNASRPTSLEEYRGIYESDELPGRFQIRADGTRIVLQPETGRSRMLESVMKDHFLGAGIHLQFQRNSEGKVAGYRINAGRVRNIAALRVRD